MKVREGGRVINAVMMLAVGVNADSHREMLGMASQPVKPGQPGTSSSLIWLPAP